MTFAFFMPDLGEGLADAELVSWHVEEGEPVIEDSKLVDVETAKAILTVPCPVSGRLLKRYGAEGDVIPVGELLAEFESDTAPPAARSEPIASTATGLEPPVRTPVAANAAGVVNGESGTEGQTVGLVPAGPSAHRVAAAPSVRRQARERGVDLRQIAGSGPGGRVVLNDLNEPGLRPAASTPIAQVSEEREEIPMRGIRRATAEAVSAGWREIPHIFDFREADASRLVALRNELRTEGERRGDELAATLTPLALLIKIAAAALAAHPEIHGYVDAERGVIVRHRRPHLGIAVATPAGLLTPVLRDVDRLRAADIGGRVRELVVAATGRSLSRDDLSGATFLVNNLGALGSWYGTPLIPPGLGGNLAFGRIVPRPVIREGQVVAGEVLPLSIAADHRLVDGDVLAAFAATVVRLVERPSLLLGSLV